MMILLLTHFSPFFRQKKLIFLFRMKCKWIFIQVVSVFEEEKEKKLRPKRYVTFCRAFFRSFGSRVLQKCYCLLSTSRQTLRKYSSSSSNGGREKETLSPKKGNRFFFLLLLSLSIRLSEGHTSTTQQRHKVGKGEKNSFVYIISSSR